MVNDYALMLLDRSARCRWRLLPRTHNPSEELGPVVRRPEVSWPTGAWNLCVWCRRRSVAGDTSGTVR